MDTKGDVLHIDAFEKAREAASTLLKLRDNLSVGQRETLSILFNKEAADQISESLKDAEQGNIEPLENILED
jgi:hypothetical protein